MATSGSRQLVLVTVVIVALGRFADGPIAGLAALLLVGAVAFGTLQALADADPLAAEAGVPVESLIVPAGTAFSAFGAIRLVPNGVLLVPALALVAWFLGRVLATEGRLLRARMGPTAADRSAVGVELLVVAFVGYAGVAALVPGGLPEPGSGGLGAGSGVELAVLAIADAVLSFLLGYRAMALRTRNVGDVAWSALTSGGLVGIAAVAVRAIELPRLLGPAILTLVFFLWDAVRAGTPTRRRDARRIREALLLVALGALVVAWSLRLRS